MSVYNSIGPFNIKTLLGGGGIGRVFLADNVAAGREVALKLVAADDDAVAAERWGALLTQQLNHPGVVRVYGHGEIDGHFFIEMEFVSGRTLRRLLQDEGALPADRACPLAIQICDVLSAAHAFRGAVADRTLSGIIHGDLSWSNVLVQPGDHVKIIDFGVADALSETRSWKTVKGQTPNFAAPEQLKPGEMRVESDIWALGVLLYIMLTQQLPFHRTAEKSTEERILQDRPLSPEGVPPDLTAIIGRALQKSYAQRYPSAGELKADLVAFLEGRPISRTTQVQPAAFHLFEETTAADPEQTQRTQPLQAIDPADKVPTLLMPARRPDGEATERTAPVPLSPSPLAQNAAQNPSGGAHIALGRAIGHFRGHRRLWGFALALLTVVLVFCGIVLTHELSIIQQAREARERFESRQDDVETTWQKYQLLKQRDYLKLGVVPLEAALRKGLVARGEQSLDRALDPNSIPVKDDWKEVAYYFDYARRIPPDQNVSEARYNYASGMLAWGTNKKKDLARAQSLFRLATERDRTWAQPWEALGRLAMTVANQNKSKDFTQAIEYFDKAIELNSKWAKPYEERAWCYLKSAPPKLDEAIKDFEQAQKLGMDTKNVHLGLATALQQRGEAQTNFILAEVDLARAAKEYERAGIEFKRENAIVRILKGIFNGKDKSPTKDKDEEW